MLVLINQTCLAQISLLGRCSDFSILNELRDDKYEFDTKNSCVKMSFKLHYTGDIQGIAEKFLFFKDKKKEDCSDREIKLEYTFFADKTCALKIENKNEQYKTQAEEFFKTIVCFKNKIPDLKKQYDNDIIDELSKAMNDGYGFLMLQCDYKKCEELSKIETVLHNLGQRNLRTVAIAIGKHFSQNEDVIQENQEIYKNLSPKSKEIIDQIQEKISTRKDANLISLIIDWIISVFHKNPAKDDIETFVKLVKLENDQGIVIQ